MDWGKKRLRGKGCGWQARWIKTVENVGHDTNADPNYLQKWQSLLTCTASVRSQEGYGLDNFDLRQSVLLHRHTTPFRRFDRLPFPLLLATAFRIYCTGQEVVVSPPYNTHGLGIRHKCFRHIRTLAYFLCRDPHQTLHWLSCLCCCTHPSLLQYV